MIIPRPIMNTANQRNVLRMVLFLAPSAFKIPIIFVRSKMIISSPEIIVTPATANMSPKIIHTFKSKRFNHENILGFISFMVALE